MSLAESTERSKDLPKRLLLACGALAHEVMQVLGQQPLLKKQTTVHCLPAKLHNTPQFIAKEVDRYLSIYAHEYDEIIVAYGDCGTAGELDKVLQSYKATRLEGAHCYEFYAGSDLFEELNEAALGSFYLTDYLVRNFERLVIEGLGIDKHPELFDAYFKHYTTIVYLAQTESVALQSKAESIAERFNWQYEYRWVGVNGLRPLLQRSVPIAVEVV